MKELASGLAKRLILVGRNETKVVPVANEIRELNPEVKVDFVQADLASNESVRRAAAKINSLAGLDHIDIVINAAGNMAVRTYQTSADGNELQFAANYLGHFLLTNLILDKILAAPASTVVNLTSMGYEMGEVNYDDPNFDVSGPLLSLSSCRLNGLGRENVRSMGRICPGEDSQHPSCGWTTL